MIQRFPGSNPGPAPVPVAQRKSTASTRRTTLVRSQLGAPTMARWAKWIEPPGFHPGHLRVRIPSALPVRCRVTAAQRPVKPPVLVRVQVPERGEEPAGYGNAVGSGVRVDARRGFALDCGSSRGGFDSPGCNPVAFVLRGVRVSPPAPCPRSSGERAAASEAAGRPFESVLGYARSNARVVREPPAKRPTPVRVRLRPPTPSTVEPSQADVCDEQYHELVALHQQWRVAAVRQAKAAGDEPALDRATRKGSPIPCVERSWTQGSVPQTRVPLTYTVTLDQSP